MTRPCGSETAVPPLYHALRMIGRSNNVIVMVQRGVVVLSESHVEVGLRRRRRVHQGRAPGRRAAVCGVDDALAVEPSERGQVGGLEEAAGERGAVALAADQPVDFDVIVSIELPEQGAVVDAADDEFLRVDGGPLSVSSPRAPDHVGERLVDNEAVAFVGAGERVVPHRGVELMREAAACSRNGLSWWNWLGASNDSVPS